MFDHDLSTYATLKTDEMSFERLDSHDFDEKSFEHLNERDDLVVQGDSGREGTVVVDVTDEVPTTPPKFQILQKVYARDKDGVMYTAVIRRQLYGPQYHRQVEMGLVTSKEEAEKLLDDDDYEPTWHYFVHYNKWNVSFDRWVPENNVYEITDTVIAYAERISKEHRALQLEMRKPGIKGKKINGAAFLCEWKKRMLRLTKEMKFEQIGDIKTADNVDFATRLEEMDAGPDVSPTKPVKQNTWTKAALVTELKLREQGLTGKRPLSQANAVVLPFALKKIIVQQWEIISQCHMMPCLPAPTTVRQALNKYLESKNVAVHPASSTLEQQGTGIDTNISDGKTDPLKEVDELDRAKVTGAKAAGEGNEEPVDADSREQEWRDMADGIAQLFDEALASRLLYLEELPQLSVIDDLPEYSMTPFSGIYGCEHLLRLFVRLPEMLADRLSDAEARPIIARVNDFVRFLHKNHGTLLTQTHRKLNELELKEQQKMMKLEEKKIKSQVVIAATEGPIGKKPRPHKN